MGLDTDYDCWHGAYSSFYQWRMAVAEAADLPMEQSDKDGPFGDRWMVPALWHQGFDSANYLGHWDELPEDPLTVLIVHSDCDGIIPAAATASLADRLEALVPLMDEWMGSRTTQFVEGLSAAAADGADVEFA